MTYAITRQQHGATVRYSGLVSVGEFMEVVLSIHADPGYASLRYVIHDMLEVEELDFSNLDMTAMAAQELGARYTNPGVRPAVVSKDPRMAEATRSFSALAQLEVGIFTELAQAQRWVGATHPAAPQP